jgi:mannosyltransferase
VRGPSLERRGARRLDVLLLLVLAAASALRLYNLVQQNIWWDEARNIEVALLPLWEIPAAPALDIQPPLYYWLLHLWAWLNGLSQASGAETLAFLARFLSVWFGVLGVVLVARLARDIGGRGAGVIAGVLAAASPLWVAESQESRMYTLAFALLAAAAVALWRLLGGYQQRHKQVLLLVAFSLLSALALLTHYNVLFVLVSWFTWWGIWALLRRNRWRAVGQVMGAGLLLTLFVLPAVPGALRQISVYTHPHLTIPTLEQYLVESWEGFLGGYAWAAQPLGDLGGLWQWGVLFILASGITLVIVRHSTRARGAGRPSQGNLPGATGFLLAWLVGGLALYYIAILDRGAFNVRYSSFVTPALYSLLGIAIIGWARLWKPVAGAALVLVLLGMAAGARADFTDPRFFREDTAGMVTWLRDVTGPLDLILVDQPYPFGFYYQRYTRDGGTVPPGSEAAPARYLFVDINVIDQRLNEWAAGAERIFWVQWFESDTDPRGAVSFMFNKYGQPAGEQFFQGYRVTWWEMNPPTHFELLPDAMPRVHTFEPGVAIVEVSVAGPVEVGHPVPVVVRWQHTRDDVERPLKARVAIYNAEDARVAQDDRPILNDRHLAPSEWWSDDRPLNVYSVPVPPDAPPGLYEVRLLVYDEETLEPHMGTDENGQPVLEPVLDMIEIR